MSRYTDDTFATVPRIRTAANTADVLVLSPSSNATALAGLSTNQPITPANLKHVLDNKILTGSKTWDPPSMAHGTKLTTTLTITGAEVGDCCLCAHTQIPVDGYDYLFEPYISSTNTMTVTLRNISGLSKDFASGILTGKVFK